MVQRLSDTDEFSVRYRPPKKAVLLHTESIKFAEPLALDDRMADYGAEATFERPNVDTFERQLVADHSPMPIASPCLPWIGRRRTVIDPLPMVALLPTQRQVAE